MRISNITAVITTISARYIETLLKTCSERLESIIVVCDSVDENIKHDVECIASRYDCVVINTNGIGQGMARLIGVNEVKTKYVHVIDDDDWITTGFYDDLPNEFEIAMTYHISVIEKNDFRQYDLITWYLNISCFVVRTDIMYDCLYKFKDCMNYCEDHFYYDYFYDYSVSYFSGTIFRILIKQRYFKDIYNPHNVRFLKQTQEREYDDSPIGLFCNKCKEINKNILENEVKI